MKSLVIGFLWPLLLLLLLLPPVLMLQENYWDYREYEFDPELRDFLREYESTGPTKPPTVKRLIEMFTVGERPLNTYEYCNNEIMTKQIHYKGRCYPEHYIVGVSYGELTKACEGEPVQCKNGIKICRRSMHLVEGVRCVLESGERMGDCRYGTIYVTGYPVVTCQWDEDTQIFIPNHIYNMVPRK
ncbi:inactive ribonuclease-like protein 9 [Apodemus sylvaticus]|uniref:inactive ribonuclease-like protein 9 n=1 Tax=Apodemus sylvaticus TaxID=10129 RepID=UPI002243BC21|nr:inactive ribonuclease-like protein 9 [Apodemus sylvaticus]